MGNESIVLNECVLTLYFNMKDNTKIAFVQLILPGLHEYIQLYEYFAIEEVVSVEKNSL